MESRIGGKSCFNLIFRRSLATILSNLELEHSLHTKTVFALRLPPRKLAQGATRRSGVNTRFATKGSPRRKTDSALRLIQPIKASTQECGTAGSEEQHHCGQPAIRSERDVPCINDASRTTLYLQLESHKRIEETCSPMTLHRHHR
jgi:hypothetical protein